MPKHTITLPWISSKTNPNGGGHYLTVHGARKKRKGQAWQCACGIPKPKDKNKKIPVTIVFNHPTKRMVDMDNAIASLKGDIDGIAAYLGVDDKVFRPITLDDGVIGKPGSVEVTLTF